MKRGTGSRKSYILDLLGVQVIDRCKESVCNHQKDQVIVKRKFHV